MLPFACSRSESSHSAQVGRSRFSRCRHLISALWLCSSEWNLGQAVNAVTGIRLWAFVVSLPGTIFTLVLRGGSYRHSVQSDGERLLRTIPARLYCYSANLLHCRSPYLLRFERVDTLGAYSIPSGGRPSDPIWFRQLRRTGFVSERRRIVGRIRPVVYNSPNLKPGMEVLIEMSTVNISEEAHYNRWGGIAALLLAVGYMAIIPLFMRAGAPPATGEAWFRYLPGRTAVWWAILWLSILTDLLYLPVAWVLWFALRKAGRNLMLSASVCWHLFVVLDLAVTWTRHASLLALFQRYASSSDEAHRAAYLAAAEYASAMLATPLFIFYAIVIPSVGVLLAGIAMMKARFGKASGWTGVITGVLGVLSLTGFYPLVIANAFAATLWFFLVGLLLLRPGRTLAAD